MRSLFTKISVLAAAALLAFGCNDSSNEDKVITLDMSLVSFKAQDEAQTVKVLTNVGFTATPSDKWITVTPGDGEFSVAVADNDTEEERNGSVTVSAAGYQSATLTVNQSAASAPGEAVYKIYEELLPFNGAVSPSGKWLAGFTQSIEGNNFTYYPIRINLETGEMIRHDGISETMYPLDDINCVDDNGTAYYMYAYSKTLKVDLDNTFYEMPHVPGYTAATNVYGTNGDGSILIGYTKTFSDAAGNSIHVPIRIVDGVAEVLEQSDLSYRGTISKGGQIARGCSIDGSIIWGTDWTGTDAALCYWSDKDGYKFHWAGEKVRNPRIEKGFDYRGEEVDIELVDGVQAGGSTNYLSPNGKWLSGAFTTERLSEDKKNIEKDRNYPYFYDVENDVDYILKDFHGYSGCGATDDGLGIICEASMATSTSIVDIKTGQLLGTAGDWIYEKYGIHVPSNLIKYICPNGIIYGWEVTITAIDVYNKSWVVFPNGLNY